MCHYPSLPLTKGNMLPLHLRKIKIIINFFVVKNLTSAVSLEKSQITIQNPNYQFNKADIGISNRFYLKQQLHTKYGFNQNKLHESVPAWP